LTEHDRRVKRAHNGTKSDLWEEKEGRKYRKVYVSRPSEKGLKGGKGRLMPQGG